MTAESEILEMVRLYPDITARAMSSKFLGHEDDGMTSVIERHCLRLVEEHRLTPVDLGDVRGYEIPAPNDMSVLRSAEDVDPRLVTNLDDLTIEERRILVLALSDSGKAVTLPCVVNSFSKRKECEGIAKHTLRVRAYRAARRLYTRGLATIEKRTGGLIWVIPELSRIAALIAKSRTQPEAPTPAGFNLIKGTCKIPTSGSGQSGNPPKTGRPRKTADLAALPKRASDERLEAVRLLKGVRMLRPEDKKEVDRSFSEYLENIDDKIIALMDGNTGETIGAEYSTRFNDYGKAVDKLDQFDAAIEQSLKDHTYATFLTMTTNPNLSEEERRDYEAWELSDMKKRLRYTSGREADKLRARIRRREDPDRIPPEFDPQGFGSLYEANRMFAPCWNKFMQFLTKRFGSRQKYIAAFEYTDSGLLHIHVLIFVRYLLKQEEISKEWAKLGQGKIVYVYSLKNRMGPDGERGWYWVSKRRPDKAKGYSGGDYLKKYLKKSLLAMTDNYASQADIQSLYWAHNKRMFTCSRCFLSVAPKKEKAPTAFSFWRIIDGGDVDMVDRMVYHRTVPKEHEEGPPDAVTMPGRCRA